MSTDYTKDYAAERASKTAFRIEAQSKFSQGEGGEVLTERGEVIPGVYWGPERESYSLKA